MRFADKQASTLHDMVHFSCRCGNVLFFENTACVNCGVEVGYDPQSNDMVALDPGFVRCANGVEHGVCNWVIPEDSQNKFCPACQLNHTIPDLSVEGNLEFWRRMESAKRRTLYTLNELGLHPVSKLVSQDGLAFDFLHPTPTQKVLTGHEHGVITINLLEANDPYRENMRSLMNEPYRTLVGHFRHEIGHYYWDRFFLNRPTTDPLYVTLRELFGDESADYDAALKRHHSEGPPANWAANYISAYATCHPWEDWAETWAQYLQIVDGMETARDFGWDSREVPIPFTPFAKEDAAACPDRCEDLEFLETVNSWAKLAPALNEISASLGHQDLYPFVFSPSAVRKICFIHSVLKAVNEEDPAHPAVEETEEIAAKA